MLTQKFKGDETELKMEAAGKPAFDLCSVSLDDFFANGYQSADFLLMLYDSGRAPFSDRVPRDSFVEFVREAIARFPFTGSFDSYIFIIEKIFGTGSGVLFTVPAAGKLEMLVNAASSIDFNFIAKEFIGGVFVNSEIVDQDGVNLSFTGISGIDSEYELNQLLAELIPVGIFPDVTLSFFEISDFIAYTGGVNELVVDHLGNQIVFLEM